MLEIGSSNSNFLPLLVSFVYEIVQKLYKIVDSISCFPSNTGKYEIRISLKIWQAQDRKRKIAFYLSSRTFSFPVLLFVQKTRLFILTTRKRRVETVIPITQKRNLMVLITALNVVSRGQT